MSHNKEEVSARELFRLLESIQGFIEKRVNMYALGGTALTILNIKRSTLDIDINIDTDPEYRYVCEVFDQVGFEKVGPIRWLTQEGLAFDLFRGSNILGTELLEDCIERSDFVRSFGNIYLYTLSLQDIIISKLARGDNRDFEDIRMIFEKEDIDLEDLVLRYRKTMETSVVAQHVQKILDLIDFKFREWGFPVDERLVEEVKSWKKD